MIVIDREVGTRAQRREAVQGAAFAPSDQTILEIAGPGAVTCVQGVLTNDLDQPGDGAFLYGATLTPKGMVLSDVWVARVSTDQVRFFVPPNGREAMTDVIRRYFPPRLAKMSDETDHYTVLRLVGPAVFERLSSTGFDTPAAGTVRTAAIGGTEAMLCRPPADMPFALQIVSRASDRSAITGALETMGIAAVLPQHLDLGRILAGWPRLGAEIGDKTLPQEVRFDENHGVSYTKGCYAGQETVARVHFRGKTNRRLMGLRWEGEPDFADEMVTYEGREVGRVSSAAWLDEPPSYVGLTVLRREVDSGASVTAAGAAAKTCELPFGLDSD